MAISLVANTTIAAASTSNTPAVNTTGANLLIIAISYYSLGNPTTVHDSWGNTYTALTAYTQNTVGVRIYYSIPATVGPGTTFGFTVTDAYVSLEAMAFSGMASSSVYQGLVSGAGSTGTTVQPGSISPSGSTLLISAAGWSASATASIGSSFNITNQNNHSATSFGGAAAYLIQSSGSAINPLWTISGGEPLVATQAAFSGAAASTAGPTFMRYGFGF